MRLMRVLLPAAAVCVVSGCASLTTSNETMVRVETVAADGVEVKDAKCSINRAGAKIEFQTPSVIGLPKSSADVIIDCTKLGQPDGRGVLTSRVGAATFGNILAGGGIGAIVDQATGKAYNYPEWVRIMMGRVLGFDRSNHVDSNPTPGKEIPGAAMSPAPAALPAPASAASADDKAPASTTTPAATQR